MEIVIVAGAARSGKSWLCALVDSHPAVLAWPFQMSLTRALDADLHERGSGVPIVRGELERHAGLLTEHRASFFESMRIDDDRVRVLADALRATLAEPAATAIELLRMAMRSAADAIPSARARAVSLVDAKVKIATMRAAVDAGMVARTIVAIRDPVAVYRELRRKHFLNYGYGHWGTPRRPLLPSLARHLEDYGGQAWCAEATVPSVLCVTYEEISRNPGVTAVRVAGWLGIEPDWPLRETPTRFGLPASLDVTREAASGLSLERFLIGRTSERLSPWEASALARLDGRPAAAASWSLLPGELWAVAKAPWHAPAILATGRANRRRDAVRLEVDEA